MNVAREVTNQIVSDNRGLRYGLFTFNPPADGNRGPGGSLQIEVKDFSETVSPAGSVITSASQAQTNFEDFVDEVNDVDASTNTPLAESYYEMTRYLRGLAPDQGLQTLSGSSTYESPIEYRCQRTFSIVVTDGLPTFDRSFPNDDPKRNNPSVTGNNNLPNWDGDSGNDGNDSSGDAEGDTLFLDDIAKFAYDIDLRDTTAPDLAGKSFNAAGFAKQNMQTYTVGFATSNDMLEDAADYGNGEYYTANDASELNDSLSKAINAITAQAGSGGAGASSSATLTADTVYYKTLYEPSSWSGTIEAYRLNSVTGRADTLLWTTDNTFTPSLNPASYQGYNTATNAPVTLAYGNLSPAQQAQLNGSVSSPITGADLLSWSKGASISGLRSRSVLLGDVVNSSLERVAPETQSVSAIVGDLSYDSYLAYKTSELETSLIVNANDGFFHILNADNGQHRYGYMPSSVLPSLNIVAEPDYAESGTHRFLVDGQISVSDAQLGSTWSTVAVSGMGAGGKSMFAVRLFQQTATNPNTPSALWELSPPAANTPSNQWNDLGYTYSRAAIARTKDNQWVAVFGNGYGSHTGKAALYIVDLATGALVRKIVVDENTSGTAAEQARGSGLASPQIVVNAQHQIEKIYAGDLRGNLWKFDTSSTLESDWSASKLFAAGSTQPITTYPLITEHPQGGHLVSFGTGKLAEAPDKLTKTQQAFYSIWDSPTNTGEVVLANLQPQSITDEVTIGGQDYFRTSANPVDFNTQKGWYLPLIYNGVAEGERVIFPAQTTEGRVVFVTAIIDAEDPCVSSGSGRLVELDLLTGGMLNYEVLDTNRDGRIDDNDSIVAGIDINEGLPGLPVIIDRGDDKPTQTKAVLLSTGQTLFLDERAAASGLSRRIMWRQLQ
ncbi:type IV pilus-associated protein [Halopseudomonas salina]|uniref:Type IV pilus-associated protein n=2 Tax=Halopseudomonas salina TaxID=1323744 RepID=A0ABQ1PW78_9GAMM|nr:type IV pilus-associated protein [Halopseudomonas salina]